MIYVNTNNLEYSQTSYIVQIDSSYVNAKKIYSDLR